MDSRLKNLYPGGLSSTKHTLYRNQRVGFLFFTFALIASQFSCNSSERSEISNTDVKKILEQRKPIGDTLKFWTYRKIQTTSQKDLPILLGIYKGTDTTEINLYQSHDNELSWKKSFVIGLEKVHVLNKEEWVRINGKSYFSIDYSTLPVNGKNGEIHFDILDPVIGKLSTLKYTYKINNKQLKGGFSKTDLDSLKKNPLVFTFLQRRSAASELLPLEDQKSYLPTYDAALRKWAMLNEGVYESLEDKQSKNLHLNVEEYSTDIYPVSANVKNDSSGNLITENGAFRVCASPIGPVYVFNRQSKHSFLIWAPADSNSRIEKMKLKNTNTLLLFPRSIDQSTKPYSIEINLVQKTVKKNLIK